MCNYPNTDVNSYCPNSNVSNEYNGTFISELELNSSPDLNHFESKNKKGTNYLSDSLNDPIAPFNIIHTLHQDLINQQDYYNNLNNELSRIYTTQITENKLSHKITINKDKNNFFIIPKNLNFSVSCSYNSPLNNSFDCNIILPDIIKYIDESNLELQFKTYSKLHNCHIVDNTNIVNYPY